MDWNKFRADTAAMIYNSMIHAFCVNPYECASEAHGSYEDNADLAIKCADILTEKLKAKED